MTAPFTASNGYEVHVNSVGYIVIYDDEGGGGFQSGDLWEGDLRALVEYAATIGITAEPSEEA